MKEPICRIKKIVASMSGMGLRGDEIADDEPIFEGGLELDSSISMELILALEDSFGVLITDEDLTLPNFATPAAIANFIGRKQSRCSPHPE